MPPPQSSPAPVASGFQEFLDNLLSLLSDENQSIVTYAARALREYDTQQVREGLLGRLTSCPPACVDEVIATLESLHGDRCPELFYLLALSSSAEVRARAIDRLGPHLAAESCARVRELLERETDNRCRACYLTLLGRLSPELTARDLGAYLASEDPRVRANAVELLGKCGGPPDAAALEPLLSDSAPRVRANTMRLLWPEQSERLWGLLKGELASADGDRELSALYLLGQVPVPEEAVELLLERLESKDLQRRMLASKTLLTFAGKVDCSVLASLYMEEESEPIRRNLMGYCRARDPRAAIRIFGALLDDSEKPVEARATAARALGDLTLAEAVPVLVRHLKDDDPRVRSNSIEALTRCPGEGLLELVMPLLDDPHNRVQATAALAVWRMGGRDAVEVLLKMLRSKDPKRQASAAFALGEIGSTELVAPLTELLDDLQSAVVTTEAQRQVHKNVMKALAKIRSPG